MGILRSLLSGRGGGFRAATPENPSFDLNSPDAWDALGAERSATGQPVSANSALSWSAWWRGVTLLARDTAKTHLGVYRRIERKDGEGKSLDRAHPAFHLLRHKANELQTAFHFRHALTGHAVNRGNGYAYIYRTRGGDPVEMVILDPDKTDPIRTGNDLWYVTEVGGDKRKLPAADVFHLRGFGFDGLQGYPAFKMAKDAIALGLAGNKFKATRYRNSARPSVVLETPNKMKPEDRTALREDWERMHTGLDNSHRTAILDNGLKLAAHMHTAEEMQEVEQAGLTIRDAANFLGIPSSKIGDVAGIKYMSKEQDDQNYLDDGLDFWFCSYEAEAWDKLLAESEKTADSHCIEFNRKQLIRADMIALANYHRTATGGRGWETVNEARQEMGYDPVDDPDADKVLTPLNMGQGGPDNKPANDAPAPPATKEKKKPKPAEGAVATATVRGIAAAAMTDAARRMVRRVGQYASRSASSPAKYLEWVRTFEDDHRAVIRDAFATAELAARAVAPCEPGASAEKLLAMLREEYNRLADTATPKGLAAAVEALTAEQEVRVSAELVAHLLGEVQ